MIIGTDRVLTESSLPPSLKERWSDFHRPANKIFSDNRRSSSRVKATSSRISSHPKTSTDLHRPDLSQTVSICNGADVYHAAFLIGECKKGKSLHNTTKDMEKQDRIFPCCDIAVCCLMSAFSSESKTTSLPHSARFYFKTTAFARPDNFNVGDVTRFAFMKKCNCFEDARFAFFRSWPHLRG